MLDRRAAPSFSRIINIASIDEAVRRRDINYRAITCCPRSYLYFNFGIILLHGSSSPLHALAEALL